MLFFETGQLKMTTPQALRSGGGGFYQLGIYMKLVIVMVITCGLVACSSALKPLKSVSPENAGEVRIYWDTKLFKKDETVLVRIDGLDALELTPMSSAKLKLSEGLHEINIKRSSIGDCIQGSSIHVLASKEIKYLSINYKFHVCILGGCFVALFVCDTTLNEVENSKAEMLFPQFKEIPVTYY